MTHERTLFLLSLIIQVLSASSGDSVSLPSLGTLTKVGGQKKALGSQVRSGTDSSSVSHENLDCRVCLSKKIDVIFYKCGHMFCCENCALKMNGSCPVCRSCVDDIVKIYL